MHRHHGTFADVHPVPMLGDGHCDRVRRLRRELDHVTGFFELAHKFVAHHLAVVDQGAVTASELQHPRHARTDAVGFQAFVSNLKRLGATQRGHQAVCRGLGQVEDLAKLRQGKPLFRGEHNFKDRQVAVKGTTHVVCVCHFISSVFAKPIIASRVFPQKEVRTQAA
ncbi:hypothetical protein D3C86_1581480 [compost metagenome]